MSSAVSPLAPKDFARMPPISGVRLGSVEAGIKYRGRRDLMAIVFDHPAQAAGVLTRSRCASAPVEWCRQILPGGVARCLVVNSGNANAFTGMRGAEAVRQTAEAAAAAFGCAPEQAFIASTGVIGEPLDVSRFGECLKKIAAEADTDFWSDAAHAIMTTDTYPKMASIRFPSGKREYVVNGIAKGSGMIAPDMATMLAFIVTDLPVSAALLQELLRRDVADTFNAITVDSDMSTSDTVLLFSAGNGNREIAEKGDRRLVGFRRALKTVLHDLAMQVIRDGEGATKHVEVTVTGARSARSAKRIARSVADSPLVKTAIAGEDANWGRIVMAVGKAGEPADRDRLSIHFGDVRVAWRGERDPDYSEAAASAVMKRDYIPILIELGLGMGRATVWTCDLTAEYVAINADYRS
jgi:glutamate N-acetyltransferase / amino-acid N-acetyltransferase